MLGFTRSRLVLVSSFYASIAGILCYTALLQTQNLPAMIFNALFILSTCSAALVVITREDQIKTKLLVIISWVLTLQIVNSNLLRLPPDVVSNQSDTVYLQQLISSILSAGTSVAGTATGNAFEYSFYPAIQIFTATLSLETGADLVMIIKLLPSILSLIILLIAFCFYRTILSENEAVLATLFAGSCFWFLYLLSQLEQAAFGTLFATILLLSLTKRGASWRVIFTISLVALASSHLLSSVYMLFILGAATIYTLVRTAPGKRSPRIELSPSMLALGVLVVLAWLVYPAFLYSPELLAIVQQALSLVYAHPHLLSGGSSGATVFCCPYVTRTTGVIGVALFGSILALGFLYLNLREREHCLMDLMPYAFGGAIICFVQFFVYSFASSEYRVLFGDLLPRGFWWVYLLAAPVAVFVLKHNWHWPRITNASSLQPDTKTMTHQRRLRIKQMLVFLTVVMVLLPSMYFYYLPVRYDNSQPASGDTYMSVLRSGVPLEQWVSVGVWSLSHMPNDSLYGDKLTYVYIGGLAAKHVHEFPVNGTLESWFQSEDLRGAVLVLRMSILDEPHYQLSVDSNQLSSIMQDNNVIYNSGDPVIIIVRE